jgi:hypothetical protein
MCGIQEKDDFPLGQAVFEAVVYIDEFGLSQRASLGRCRLAFLEGEAVAIEPIRHARDGELNTKKALDFFDCGLVSWHIASGQNGTQPGGLVLG